MKLIGQYDSPFVRRVAIAMRTMGLAYEHLPWSVFADADRIAAYSPLLRVPVLLLDDETPLTESWAILDHLESISQTSLWPADPVSRTRAFSIAALATGLADKAVSLVYERVLRDAPLQLWVERCRRQISAAADELERIRMEASDTYLFGPEISHADIAVAAAWRFIGEAHQEEFDRDRWPALKQHSDHCEALPHFQAVQQRFVINR